jgi:hypothetical protein
MKLLKIKNILSFVFLMAAAGTTAQDSVTHNLILNLNYYMPDNRIPYLKVSAKEKVERQFLPQQDIAASVYIGEQTDANLLGKIRTGKKGEASLYIPSKFKALWDSSASLNFSAVTEANKIFESTTAELAITKSKIEIDTLTEEGVRKIIVKVMELKDNEWLPAKDVELKVAVKRSLGNVPVGDEESYTTDSTGLITAEFKRDSLPGDVKGDITIIAWTDENETYGNITAEKIVNWGESTIIDNTFFQQRTLWAKSSKTPFWLLALAYGVTLGVWGTIIYLITRIIKMRKLGKLSA